MTFPDASATDGPWSPGDTYEIQVYPAEHPARGPQHWVAYHLNGTEADAQKYISEHPDDYAEHYARLLSRIISHELSHGIGAPDHTPRTAGDKKCVMRYFAPVGLPQEPGRRLRAQGQDLAGFAVRGCWSKVDVSDQR